MFIYNFLEGVSRVSTVTGSFSIIQQAAIYLGFIKRKKKARPLKEQQFVAALKGTQLWKFHNIKCAYCISTDNVHVT